MAGENHVHCYIVTGDDHLFHLDSKIRDCCAELMRVERRSLGSLWTLNEPYEEDGAIVFREACKLGCEGIVSKRLSSTYRSGRSPHWVKVKNPKAPAVTREAEEDWGR
jgi:ATP-dependent DNA ligase